MAEGVQDAAADPEPEEIHNAAWHTPLLAFVDHDLERQYEAHKLEELFSGDCMAAALHIVQCLLLIVVSMTRNSQPLPKDELGRCDWTLYSGSCVLCAHGALVCLLPKALYLRWRTIFITLVNSGVLLLLLRACCLNHDLDLPVSGSGSFWWSLILQTGIFAANWQTLTLPTMFKHHVYVQSVMLLLQVIVLRPTFCVRLFGCSDILGSQPVRTVCPVGASTSCAGPLPASDLRQLHLLHKLITGTAGTLHTWFTRPPWESENPPSDESICEMSVSFLQLALGWWLPSAVLYYVEKKSREFFLRYYIRAGLIEPVPGVDEEEEEMALITRLFYFVFVSMVFVVRWCWFLVMIWSLLVRVV